jgi:hypothetical protein
MRDQEREDEHQQYYHAGEPEQSRIRLWDCYSCGDIGIGVDNHVGYVCVRASAPLHQWTTEWECGSGAPSSKHGCKRRCVNRVGHSWIGSSNPRVVSEASLQLNAASASPSRYVLFNMFG